jgi:hypothetical protein
VRSSPDNQIAIPGFLFKKLVPLSRDLHERAGLSVARSYREYQFHWLPIVLSEIPAVAPYFPIAVADLQVPVLAAIVGLHPRQSLFIDRCGNWTGEYLPLYLRQMPFHIVSLRAAGTRPRATICIDIDSPLVDDSFTTKVIADGVINPACDEPLAAASQFEREIAATSAFVQTLERSGLAVQLGSAPEQADFVELRALRGVSQRRLHDGHAEAQFSASALPLLHACARSLDNLARLKRLQGDQYAQEETLMRADL